jgi:transcriptional regulator with XRE-family HTH domain
MPRIHAQRLRRTMDATGTSTTKLAEKTGTSVSYMARIVKGSNSLERSPALRHKIADALGVPLDAILPLVSDTQDAA